MSFKYLFFIMLSLKSRNNSITNSRKPESSILSQPQFPSIYYDKNGNINFCSYVSNCLGPIYKTYE